MTTPNLDAAQAIASHRRKPVGSVAASGRIYFWQSGSLWIGKGQGRSEWHQHHAHQLALALDGEFKFRADKHASWTRFEAAIVPSHCPHEFEIDGATIAHLFVEPESTEGRMLSSRFGALKISALAQPAARESAERLSDALHGHADAQAMRCVARAALARLAGPSETVGEAASEAARDATPRSIDPRVARSLDYLRSRVRAPVSLADAAGVATLSPSRFRHLFVEETGTSFRSYLLWLRINVAIEAAMAGASWTQAAHEAGFADSSHLTRTHRRMFGIEPTAIRHD